MTPEKIKFQTESHENFSQLKDEVCFGQEQAVKLNEKIIKQELLGEADANAQFQGNLAEVLNSLTQKKSKPKKGEAVISPVQQMVKILLDKGYFNNDPKLAQENCQKILNELNLKIAKDADIANQDPSRKGIRIANNLLLGGIRGLTYFTVGSLGTALGNVAGGVGALAGARFIDRVIVNQFKKAGAQKYKDRINANENGLKESLAQDLVTLISKTQREQLLVQNGLPLEGRTVKQHYETAQSLLFNSSAETSFQFENNEQKQKAAQMIAIEQTMEDETALKEQKLAQRKGSWPQKILSGLKGANDFFKPTPSNESDFAQRSFATAAWSFGVGFALREGALNMPFFRKILMAYGGARGGYAVGNAIFDRGQSSSSENIAKQALTQLSRETAKKQEYEVALARARLALEEMKSKGKNQVEIAQLEKQIKQYEFHLLYEKMTDNLDKALKDYKGEDIKSHQEKLIKIERNKKMAGKWAMAGLGAIAAPIIGDRLADIAQAASTKHLPSDESLIQPQHLGNEIKLSHPAVKPVVEIPEPKPAVAEILDIKPVAEPSAYAEATADKPASPVIPQEKTYPSFGEQFSSGQELKESMLKDLHQGLAKKDEPSELAKDMSKTLQQGLGEKTPSEIQVVAPEAVPQTILPPSEHLTTEPLKQEDLSLRQAPVIEKHDFAPAPEIAPSQPTNETINSEILKTYDLSDAAQTPHVPPATYDELLSPSVAKLSYELTEPPIKTPDELQEEAEALALDVQRSEIHPTSPSAQEALQVNPQPAEITHQSGAPTPPNESPEAQRIVEVAPTTEFEAPVITDNTTNEVIKYFEQNDYKSPLLPLLKENQQIGTLYQEVSLNVEQGNKIEAQAALDQIKSLVFNQETGQDDYNIAGTQNALIKLGFNPKDLANAANGDEKLFKLAWENFLKNQRDGQNRQTAGVLLGQLQTLQAVKTFREGL